MTKESKRPITQAYVMGLGAGIILGSTFIWLTGIPGHLACQFGAAIVLLARII